MTAVEEGRLHGTIIKDGQVVGMWEGVPVSNPTEDPDRQFVYSCQYAEVGYGSGEYEVEIAPTWGYARKAIAILTAGYLDPGARR